ncbi:NUDIX hydrolase [Methylicorpusculum oleiharenae]|uniref:NUDIX hydrolase n=1 Tax=Methylicorpusculum oleiharenae TaxID=1338687 RepID=UPI001359EDA9|nr:NUDIX hydrolase [Methylicorpusculum oleiharenae]MCD2452405.1 NUDIX hydrolase [Methylicorpusculum oleiharenae]
MTRNLIKTLITAMPRYAEEEGDFYGVKRGSLIETLRKQHDIDVGIAENTVLLCECLLDSLSVLKADLLLEGEWSFVSFPAQLMATSVLTTMCDSQSRFFAANFWNTQGISSDKKNQQRDVLRIVENVRLENHAGNDAQPIRYCYVAWSIIKLDGKVLFYQREDTQKRHDKSAGDYGLIGGRANQNDVPIGGKVSLLRELQSPNSGLIKNALTSTLKRELREEAGLLFDLHYTFKPWRTLKPYRQVQGAAPNHALTEYYLEIFYIDLTLEGCLFLHQKIKPDDRLAWFSIEDMVRGETIDGKIPYIKALVKDFSDDSSALATELMALPDSFASRYLFQPPKYGLTLPIDHRMPLLAGVLGKEKPLEINLTERQLAILLGLASHLRGFEFATVEENINFHPFGWIEVKRNFALQTELISLAGLFTGTDLIIENHCDNLFRLSISPYVVYFDERLFSFAVKQADLNGIQTKIPVNIHRESFETAWGKVKDNTDEFKLTLEFVHKLQSLVVRQFPTDNEDAVKIEDTYKKGLHKEPRFLALGLRSLIRREAGIFKFILGFTNA